MLRIVIVTPAPPQSRYGNRTTALRWAAELRALGHRVVIRQLWGGEPAELLLALHARRSHTSIQRFHRAHPNRPLVVALTGTDLYRDLERSRRARESLSLSTRLIVLQPLAIEKVPAGHRPKVRVIYQSVQPQKGKPPKRNRTFDVCVPAHLRWVKDPFRAAMASRLLPAGSQIRVLQVGGAMKAAMAKRARAEARRNPRYRWLGELPRWRALRVLASSRLMVISSRLEGGANVVSEALAQSVPVLASRIPGNLGLLGDDYPGVFEVGDTRGLARLLLRAEREPAFLAALSAACRRRKKLTDPALEKQTWKRLLRELFA